MAVQKILFLLLSPLVYKWKFITYKISWSEPVSARCRPVQNCSQFAPKAYLHRICIVFACNPNCLSVCYGVGALRVCGWEAATPQSKLTVVKVYVQGNQKHLFCLRNQYLTKVARSFIPASSYSSASCSRISSHPLPPHSFSATHTSSNHAARSNAT